MARVYVVTVGRETGVFDDWLKVQSLTIGVPGSAYRRCRNYTEADRYLRDAMNEGRVEKVRLAPDRRDSGRAEPEQNRAQRAHNQHQETRREVKREERRAGRGASSRTGSASTTNGRAVRNALIAAAVEDVKREKEQNGNGVYNAGSASAREFRRPEPSSRTGVAGRYSGRRTNEVATASPRLPYPSARTGASASVVRTSPQGIARPAVRPVRQVQQGAKTSSSLSTSSSPPTAVTQTRNVFSSSESANVSPRYAQSLSYASSPGNSSAGMRSPPIASSDRRSRLSSPSSLGTRYFPEDYPARQAQAHAAQRGPRLSDEVSEYATAPNTPEMPDVDLPDLNSTSIAIECMDVRSPVVSPPQPPPQGMTTSTSNNTSSRRKTPVTRSLSDAQVQTEARLRQLAEAIVQTASPTERRYINDEAQTSTPRAIPLRATASEGVKSFGEQGICACRHPDYICRRCGRTPTHVMGPVDSHLASATPVSAASPSSPSSVRTSGSFETPSIRASTDSQSVQSPQGGNTPFMGPSERNMDVMSSVLSIQAAMDTMHFSERGGGPGHTAVVHDVAFDPRSPLQRGTTVPAGTSGSAARPSPAMVPRNSLLFSL
ncbi:hypothetical protein C8Q74DRAFT_684642 [Fomes fomentarius]|nr:hypothetical protein C8Q74DRAFT_684642 [Fomes fomentarius]